MWKLESDLGVFSHSLPLISGVGKRAAGNSFSVWFKSTVMGSGKLSGMREDRWAGCRPSTTEPWTGGSAGPAGGAGADIGLLGLAISS